VGRAGESLIGIPTKLSRLSQRKPTALLTHRASTCSPLCRTEPVALPESPFITVESIVAIMEVGALIPAPTIAREGWGGGMPEMRELITT
jgi:hypothetical protein